MAVLLATNAGFIPTSHLQIAKPELLAFRWDIHELNSRVAEYGYGGIELHWSSAFKHCRDLARVICEDSATRGIVSGHESWYGVANPTPANPERTPPRVIGRENLILSIGSALLFPTGARSLDYLECFEQSLKRPDAMHYVMFPDPDGNLFADQRKTNRFPNSSIQPTADVGASWGVETIGDFTEELWLRGYKATIDSFHISRQAKVVINRADWVALSEQLLIENLVSEVHVSVGRTDFRHIDERRYKQSVTEMLALVENKTLDETPLGILASQLAGYRWSGNVVIETTIPGLSATFGRLTPALLAELHQNITEGVKKLLPHITWESKFEPESAVPQV